MNFFPRASNAVCLEQNFYTPLFLKQNLIDILLVSETHFTKKITFPSQDMTSATPATLMGQPMGAQQ